MSTASVRAQVRAEQFEIVAPETVRHQPTGTLFRFPLSAPRDAGAGPLCHIEGGDTVAPNGENYALRDMIAQARAFLISRPFAKAS